MRPLLVRPDEVGDSGMLGLLRKRIHPSTGVVNEYVIVRFTGMNQRSVVLIIVALAVLLTQGGGLMLGAICPHLRAQQNSCHESMPEVVVSHDSQANSEAVESPDAASCTHCAIQSRTRQDESAPPQVNTAQRIDDPIVPLGSLVIRPAAMAKNVAWTAQAHGPPGNPDPLHLLHHVFRI